HRQDPDQAQPAGDGGRPGGPDRRRGGGRGDRGGARAGHRARHGGAARPGPLPVPAAGRARRTGGGRLSELIATYHAQLEDFGRELAEWGGQGLMVLDATWLETIEEEYGADAFEEVRNRVLRVL